MSSLATILELARHELDSLLRTRRVVVVAALYLGLAILGGVIYVVITRYGEQTLLDAMQLRNGGPGEADQENLRMAMREGHTKLTGWLAGAGDIEVVATALRESLILPLFLWSSLAFLPFVIIATSFDHITNDLQVRSLCYSILRAHRAEIVLGKFAAHTLVFVLLTAVSSLVLVTVAGLSLESSDLASELGGLPRVWLVLLPFGMCYLAISSFCSAANKQTTPALLSAFAVIILLRVVGALDNMPVESDWRFLHHLSWLSPATHQAGLWRADWVDVLLSTTAYGAFAVGFLVLATAVLSVRDL